MKVTKKITSSTQKQHAAVHVRDAIEALTCAYWEMTGSFDPKPVAPSDPYHGEHSKILNEIAETITRLRSLNLK